MSDNIWDTVNNPPEDAPVYFGEASIASSWCALVPGQGKVPWQEGLKDEQGRELRRYARIDFSVVPLAESNLQYPVTRTMIAEFGEWKEYTLPSIKAAGITEMPALQGKFVQIELVPTGRKYQSNGTEKEATAIKLVRVFAGRDECVTAYAERFGKGKDEQIPFDPPYTEAAPAAPAAAPTPTPKGNGDEHSVALMFAESFVREAVQKAGGDLAKARDLLAPVLAGQPMTKDTLTVDSPEIIKMMTAAVS